MSHEEAAWAAIRIAYEAGEETVSAVAKRLRVSEGAIYRRARRDGWSRRMKRPRPAESKPAKPYSGGPGTGPERAPRKPANAAGKAANRKSSSEAASSAGLIARLYNAMDAKLKRLEARMHSDEQLTAAESERETRELGSMIRSFEKVTAFAATLEERDKPAKRKPAINPGDAERMREEIAQRLERLCADRAAQTQSGDAE
ncbi:MAG: hypothetical protein KJ622_13040 [Alphaproteobacteria bacterium]|nr:hypothetical protein [Alphaproteobacteria bacterium]